MADRIKFQEKLNGIWDMAKSQGGRISLEEVEIYFEEDHLSEEQMNLVCEYLLSQKMAVTGYIQTKGRVKDRGEEQEGDRLSSEEQAYVEEYLKNLDQMSEHSAEEVRMAYYLPKVVEEAVKLHHADVFIGDMIQEGNISLMLALKEIASGSDEEELILEEIRAGMLAMAEAQDETKRQDGKMVARVAELDEAIQSLKEEMGRKVSIDEVAERMGISEDEVEDILKLAGEDVKEE